MVDIFFQFLSPAWRRQAFSGMAATFKLGGLMFLSGDTPKEVDYKTGGPSEISKLYKADLLMTEFSDFELIHFADTIGELNVGLRHTGMSAFVDLITRKQASPLWLTAQPADGRRDIKGQADV